MPLSKLEELQLDVAELNNILAQSVRRRVKDILTIEIRRLETEISALKEAESTSDTVTSKPIRNPVKCYDTKLNNYAWDQSDKFVKIYVSLNDVHKLEPGNVNCVFTQRSLELNVKALNGRNYQLTINNLLENIVVEKSYWKVKTDSVVVFMAKEHPGNWQYMTTAEKKAKDPKVPKFDKDDPSAGLIGMMKQLYEDGDDDMKRTIAKAWTEGNNREMSL